MEHLKKFFKDKKNIAITILSIIVLCFAFANPTNTYTERINELNEKLKDNETQIQKLQNSNKQLENEKKTLEQKVESLDQLNSYKEDDSEQNTEQENIEQNNNNEDNKSDNDQQENNEVKQNNYVSTSNRNDDSNIMVWVTNKGKKYHLKNCRTLTDNKYEITKEQAISEGREPCGVCID